MGSGPPTETADGHNGSIEVGMWEWRELFASEHGPPDPSTRLVLLVLSLHMTKKVARCFPSQELIAKRSGLSVRAVRMHLNRAESGHWVGIQRKLREGQAWYVNEYVASIPKDLEGLLKEKPWKDPAGNDRQMVPPLDTRHGLPPVGRRPANDDRRPANGAATTGNLCRDDRHRLPTNSPSNSPMNILKERAAHAGTIEISPEERKRRDAEEAKRLADERERQRVAKAQKDAEAVNRRRSSVLTALEKLPDFTSAEIAKVTCSSVEEVEQLRRPA